LTLFKKTLQKKIKSENSLSFKNAWFDFDVLDLLSTNQVDHAGSNLNLDLLTHGKLHYKFFCNKFFPNELFLNAFLQK